MTTVSSGLLLGSLFISACMPTPDDTRDAPDTEAVSESNSAISAETRRSEVRRRLQLPDDAIIVFDDDPVSVLAGGFCTNRDVLQDDGVTYGGWVDGNGPDTYQAFAICGSSTARGLERWCGDQRQSYARCASGRYTSKGFTIRDK